MARPPKYTVKYIKELASEMLEWFQDEERIFKKDFFIYKKLPAEYASRFADKSEEFCQALKTVEDIQEQRIANGALKGKYNPTFAIFALKNVAGWRDKQDIEHGGEIGIKIVDDIK